MQLWGLGYCMWVVLDGATLWSALTCLSMGRQLVHDAIGCTASTHVLHAVCADMRVYMYAPCAASGASRSAVLAYMAGVTFVLHTICDGHGSLFRVCAPRALFYSVHAPRRRSQRC